MQLHKAYGINTHIASKNKVNDILLHLDNHLNTVYILEKLIYMLYYSKFWSQCPLYIQNIKNIIYSLYFLSPKQLIPQKEKDFLYVMLQGNISYKLRQNYINII